MQINKKLWKKEISYCLLWQLALYPALDVYKRQGPGNRLRVNEHNQIQDFKNIFAIGDTALMISEEYPKGHPQEMCIRDRARTNYATNIINTKN